jgi:hypothetical protein
MRKFIIAAALVVAGCGGSEPKGNACASSPLVNDWTLGSINISFYPTCQFVSTGACSSSGTYSNATAQSGVANVTVDQASGANPNSCLPVGSYHCTYAVSNGALAYACQ